MLVEQFFCRYGVPLSLHSDQGSNFQSNVFQSVCRLLGINKTRTTAYHPQSDGLVERFNITILSMLSMYVCDDQADWDMHIPYVMMSYRASEQETTGISPNRMMFGREINLPLDLLVTQTVPETRKYGTPEAYASEICGRMHRAFEMARNNIQGEQKRQKRLYDAKLRGKPYKVGDQVWLYCPRKTVGLSPKLQSFWKGPYVVKKCISDAVYRIKDVKTHYCMVVHFDRLKPCHSSIFEQNCTEESEDDNPVDDSQDVELQGVGTSDKVSSEQETEAADMSYHTSEMDGGHDNGGKDRFTLGD